MDFDMNDETMIMEKIENVISNLKNINPPQRPMEETVTIFNNPSEATLSDGRHISDITLGGDSAMRIRAFQHNEDVRLKFVKSLLETEQEYVNVLNKAFEIKSSYTRNGQNKTLSSEDFDKLLFNNGLDLLIEIHAYLIDQLVACISNYENLVEISGIKTLLVGRIYTANRTSMVHAYSQYLETINTRKRTGRLMCYRDTTLSPIISRILSDLGGKLEELIEAPRKYLDTIMGEFKNISDYTNLNHPDRRDLDYVLTGLFNEINQNWTLFAYRSENFADIKPDDGVLILQPELTEVRSSLETQAYSNDVASLKKYNNVLKSEVVTLKGQIADLHKTTTVLSICCFCSTLGFLYVLARR